MRMCWPSLVLADWRPREKYVVSRVKNWFVSPLHAMLGIVAKCKGDVQYIIAVVCLVEFGWVVWVWWIAHHPNPYFSL